MKTLTLAHRRKISAALVGRPKSEAHKAKLRQPKSLETRAKLAAAAVGRKHSDITKRLMSQTRRGSFTGVANPMFGRVVSTETREKLSKAGIGRHHTDATKALIAESNRRRQVTAETRQRISVSVRATRTPALRAKLSESMKRAWARDDGTMRQAVSAGVARSVRGRELLGSRGHISVYRGARLKSRVELRAAIAFDCLGWRWEYEPRIYADARGSMVPDFIVDTDNCRWLCEVGNSGRKLGKLLRLALASGLLVRGLASTKFIGLEGAGL